MCSFSMARWGRYTAVSMIETVAKLTSCLLWDFRQATIIYSPLTQCLCLNILYWLSTLSLPTHPRSTINLINDQTIRPRISLHHRLHLGGRFQLVSEYIHTSVITKIKKKKKKLKRVWIMLIGMLYAQPISKSDWISKPEILSVCMCVFIIKVYS